MQIVDDGAGNLVISCRGHSPASFEGVRTVRVRLEGGDDVFSYLLAPSPEGTTSIVDLDVGLGTGADTADVLGRLLIGTEGGIWRIDAGADSDDVKVDVRQNGELDPTPTLSKLDLAIEGGAGDGDEIDVRIEGVPNVDLNLTDTSGIGTVNASLLVAKQRALRSAPTFHREHAFALNTQATFNGSVDFALTAAGYDQVETDLHLLGGGETNTAAIVAIEYLILGGLVGSESSDHGNTARLDVTTERPTTLTAVVENFDQVNTSYTSRGDHPDNIEINVYDNPSLLFEAIPSVSTAVFDLGDGSDNLTYNATDFDQAHANVLAGSGPNVVQIGLLIPAIRKFDAPAATVDVEARGSVDLTANVSGYDQASVDLDLLGATNAVEIFISLPFYQAPDDQTLGRVDVESWGDMDFTAEITNYERIETSYTSHGNHRDTANVVFVITVNPFVGVGRQNWSLDADLGGGDDVATFDIIDGTSNTFAVSERDFFNVDAGAGRDIVTVNVSNSAAADASLPPTEVAIAIKDAEEFDLRLVNVLDVALDLSGGSSGRSAYDFVGRFLDSDPQSQNARVVELKVIVYSDRSRQNLSVSSEGYEEADLDFDLTAETNQVQIGVLIPADRNSGERKAVEVGASGWTDLNGNLAISQFPSIAAATLQYGVPGSLIVSDVPRVTGVQATGFDEYSLRAQSFGAGRAEFDLTGADGTSERVVIQGQYDMHSTIDHGGIDVDIDTKDDGASDSVWIDLEYPVVSSPDGRKYALVDIDSGDDDAEVYYAVKSQGSNVVSNDTITTGRGADVVETRHEGSFDAITSHVATGAGKDIAKTNYLGVAGRAGQAAIDVFVDGGPGDDTIHTTPPMCLEGDQCLVFFLGGFVVHGGPGDDIIVSPDSSGSVAIGMSGGPGNDILVGGDGADWLDGGPGNDIIIGGAGDDVLLGGLGRDVLIGGLGGDFLDGGPGEDILIGGSTIFDDRLAALLAIRREWTSDASYETRVSKLRLRLEPQVTVLDDEAIDVLYGSGGRDWFFADSDGLDNEDDLLLDASLNEVIDHL